MLRVLHFQDALLTHRESFFLLFVFEIANAKFRFCRANVLMQLLWVSSRHFRQ